MKNTEQANIKVNMEDRSASNESKEKLGNRDWDIKLTIEKLGGLKDKITRLRLWVFLFSANNQ